MAAESEASDDEQLALKKRARRRLVGAAALALLAALVLPVVMDHEPRPANQDIQVRIPSQEAPSGIAARVLPGKPAATPLPPAASPDAAPAEEAKPEPKAEAKPETKAEPVAKAATAPAAPAADKPAEKTPEKPAAKPAEKAADKAAAKPAEKPADVSAEKKTEEARAVSALSGDAGEWVIQLGAYKEAGNVKLLMSKLKGMGVPAYTEKFDSPQGPRTRVRAGPFPSKEAAEKAKLKVKVIGVDGPVAQK